MLKKVSGKRLTHQTSDNIEETVVKEVAENGDIKLAAQYLPQRNVESKSKQLGASQKDVSLKSLMLSDLTTLIEIHDTIEKIINPTQGKVDLNFKLKKLGDLYTRIRWCEISLECIRNKHGYRNRHKDKGNKLNTEGAKIHFETLAHLSELSISYEWQWLLLIDINAVNNALIELQTQIKTALLEESKYAITEQKEKIDAIKVQPGHKEASTTCANKNLLVILCDYYYDLVCLERIKALLTNFQTDKFEKINLNSIVDRYQLGYFFIQLGETAKELSDFIKPETNKKGKGNLTRLLFGKLGKFRQKIKDYPKIVFHEDITSITLMYLMLRDRAAELSSLTTEFYKALMNF